MNIQFENLGTVNKNKVTLGNLSIWFSYETPVAYRFGYDDIVVRENDWSKTTGKLLNELQPDKSLRLTGEQFEHQLNTILNGNGIK